MSVYIGSYILPTKKNVGRDKIFEFLSTQLTIIRFNGFSCRYFLDNNYLYFQKKKKRTIYTDIIIIFFFDTVSLVSFILRKYKIGGNSFASPRHSVVHRDFGEREVIESIDKSN